MDPYDSLGGLYGLQTASEVRSDLRFEISDLNYLHIHVHIAYIALFGGSEATTASKQPQRSNPTSDLKSVTSITYVPMAALTLHPRLHIIPTEEGNPLTCVALPQAKMQHSQSGV